MNEHCLVSVIIPTYNNAVFLPTAIESVLAQSYPNIEIIVINDGSTDDTGIVVLDYNKKIRYFEQENSGPAKARNTGIQYAKGDYIAFLDADDIWFPKKIERQMDVLILKPDTALVYSQMINFDHNSGDELYIEPLQVFSGNIFDNLLTYGFLPMPSVIVKADIVREIGGFDPSLYTGEDWHFYLQIARKYKIIGLPEVLVKRRKHNSNFSDQLDVPMQGLDSLDKIVTLFPETAVLRYPAMKNAYIRVGMEMVSSYFYASAFHKCHVVCSRLMNMGLKEPMVLLYWLITLLPKSIITKCRETKKILVTTTQ